MPHKHTRREKDLSTFDLPPSQIAKPLPVDSISKRNRTPTRTPTRKPGQSEETKGVKRKRGSDPKDDTPRAFKRLMAFAGGKKPRSGLDDGAPTTKKKSKAAKSAETETVAEEAKTALPQIRHGERLSEFASRVDQELPLSGLVNKTTRNGKDPLGLKVRRTKKEKKMHKLYDEWREEDRRIKEQREEELELAEEKQMEEEEEGGVKWKLDFEDALASGSKKKKKGKKGRYLGESTERESDPWAALKKKRGEAKVGLNETAPAPPELVSLAQTKLMVRGAAVEVEDIPKAAGSLRRREELQGVRKDVVSSYRRLMKEKRTTGRYRRADK